MKKPSPPPRLEANLRKNLLHILDDKTAPPYTGISYETGYSALYRYSMHDNKRATQFVLNVVEAAAQDRRSFIEYKLLEHCGVELAVPWRFADKDTRKRITIALLSHSVFRSIHEARRLKHKCFVDVCLGLREASRSDVIAAAAERFNL